MYYERERSCEIERVPSEKGMWKCEVRLETIPVYIHKISYVPNFFIFLKKIGATVILSESPKLWQMA